ncbi:hypothetical protein QUF80_08305, partial [Desulfococcaceae bacterium HSG8]|nr:hypothetical protein [Desulfococcaceae bacterium HSG8]
ISPLKFSLSRTSGMRKTFLLLMKHCACNILKLLSDKLYVKASISNCFMVCQVQHKNLVWRSEDGGALFSKDESRILTWSRDGTARVWNASDGKPLTEPMKHESYVNGAVFSKDESRILTWSADGTTRLWNASDGKPLSEPMKHEGSVWGAVFSKDESRILTWSSDGTARVWDIGADYDFPPEHLPLLVEVATGTAMDDAGNISVLSKDEWEARKEKYIEIAENHLKTCKYPKANMYVRQKRAWGLD